MRRYNFQLNSVEMSPENLSRYDAVPIATNHSSYDYEFVVRHSRLVIDTRNATRDITEFSDKTFHC